MPLTAVKRFESRAGAREAAGPQEFPVANRVSDIRERVPGIPFHLTRRRRYAGGFDQRLRAHGRMHVFSMNVEQMAGIAEGVPRTSWALREGRYGG